MCDVGGFAGESFAEGDESFIPTSRSFFPLIGGGESFLSEFTISHGVVPRDKHDGSVEIATVGMFGVLCALFGFDTLCVFTSCDLVGVEPEGGQSFPTDRVWATFAAKVEPAFGDLDHLVELHGWIWASLFEILCLDEWCVWCGAEGWQHPGAWCEGLFLPGVEVLPLCREKVA